MACSSWRLGCQVGNLSFYTTEEQIHDIFSKCANPEDGGGVKRIIMGLDRNTRFVFFINGLSALFLVLISLKGHHAVSVS